MKQFSNERISVKRIIYTASYFAKQNLIYLQEIGTSKYLRPYSSKRNQLSSYLFFIVKNGSGKLDYQNTSYELKEGDCVFINCNTPYTISSTENLWSLSWIHFNGPTMHGIHEKFIERCGAPCFSASNPQQFQNIYNELFEVAATENYTRDMTITGLLTNLLTYLMNDSWNKTPTTSNNVSNKWIAIKNYLDANYKEYISLDYLSDKFNINKFYLTRKFKEIYGTTINQYIINRRINASKELLRFSNLSVTEIAIQCGFCNTAYFTRIFTKIEDTTPSTFRRKWTGQIS